MKVTRVFTFGAIVLLSMAAWAQEFPRTELGVDYSYARYSPSAPYSKGHSLNGGGGSVTFNIDDYLGIKMDLQGYGSNSSSFSIPANPTFPSGLSGSVEGNLFTYLFGPQIKVRAHHFQPFANLLFGGAHSQRLWQRFQDNLPAHCWRLWSGESARGGCFCNGIRWGGGYPNQQNGLVSPCRVRLPPDPLHQPALRNHLSTQFSLLRRPYLQFRPH